ncbi:hypothetical protein L1887_17885 [Cichorium endivia]|nr:hypothetical protein L1887_17885 [Cichorium endivia]
MGNTPQQLVQYQQTTQQQINQNTSSSQIIPTQNSPQSQQTNPIPSYHPSQPQISYPSNYQTPTVQYQSSPISLPSIQSKTPTLALPAPVQTTESYYSEYDEAEEAAYQHEISLISQKFNRIPSYSGPKKNFRPSNQNGGFQPRNNYQKGHQNIGQNRHHQKPEEQQQEKAKPDPAISTNQVPTSEKKESDAKEEEKVKAFIASGNVEIWSSGDDDEQFENKRKRGKGFGECMMVQANRETPIPGLASSKHLEDTAELNPHPPTCRKTTHLCACSMHMIGRLEFLRDYREVSFGGYVTFGNDANGIIKGYGVLTNGNFTIQKVAYVLGLKHSLISVGQLVSTGLRVEFDNEFSYIMTGDMVRGMPLLRFDNENLCAACTLGKQKKKPQKSITDSSITRPLELLHMDLCSPSTVASLNHKKYILVIKLYYINRTQDSTTSKKIRSDNGTEFNNKQIEEFLASKGIEHNFSAPYTPQQNGVVERRNRTLVEAARSMLTFANLPQTFWAEAIATACFVQNRSIVNKRLQMTPYEVLNGRKPNVKFFHIFGCRCFIKNNKDHLGKFAPKSDEAIFMRYSSKSVAYRVLNKRTRVIEESFDIEFDDQYQWRKKNQDILYVMENDVPVGHRPIHTVEIDYDLLFDPPETAKDAEVVHSPDAIKQIISASGPSTSSEPTAFDNQTDPPINTSTVEGEPSLPSPNHQTQKEPSHPANSEGESILPAHVDGIPQSEGDHQTSGYTSSANVLSEDTLINSSDTTLNNPPVFTSEANDNTSAEESQNLNTSPDDTNFIQDVSPPISDPALLPRLHKWTQSHRPNQIIGDPSSKVQTRSKKSIQDECHYAAYISKVEPKTVLDALDDDDVECSNRLMEE